MKTVRNIRQITCRVIEEIFPFGHYVLSSRKLGRKVHSPDILSDQKLEEYCRLSEEQLEKRLEEEHQRALVMDEKTFKMILSLSLEVTVLSSTAVLFPKVVSFTSWIQAALNGILVIGLLYFLLAVLVMLGTFRTRPLYGYGTEFLLQQQKKKACRKRVQAEALARQESTNLGCHLRNETAYMSLRNIFLLIFTGTVIFLVTFSLELFSS